MVRNMKILLLLFISLIFIKGVFAVSVTWNYGFTKNIYEAGETAVFNIKLSSEKQHPLDCSKIQYWVKLCESNSGKCFESYTSPVDVGTQVWLSIYVPYETYGRFTYYVYLKYDAINGISCNDEAWNNYNIIGYSSVTWASPNVSVSVYPSYTTIKEKTSKTFTIKVENTGKDVLYNCYVYLDNQLIYSFVNNYLYPGYSFEVYYNFYAESVGTFRKKAYVTCSGYYSGKTVSAENYFYIQVQELKTDFNLEAYAEKTTLVEGESSRINIKLTNIGEEDLSCYLYINNNYYTSLDLVRSVSRTISYDFVTKIGDAGTKSLSISAKCTGKLSGRVVSKSQTINFQINELKPQISLSINPKVIEVEEGDEAKFTLAISNTGLEDAKCTISVTGLGSKDIYIQKGGTQTYEYSYKTQVGTVGQLNLIINLNCNGVYSNRQVSLSDGVTLNIKPCEARQWLEKAYAKLQSAKSLIDQADRCYSEVNRSISCIKEAYEAMNTIKEAKDYYNIALNEYNEAKRHLEELKDKYQAKQLAYSSYYKAEAAEGLSEKTLQYCSSAKSKIKSLEDEINSKISVVNNLLTEAKNKINYIENTLLPRAERINIDVELEKNSLNTQKNVLKEVEQYVQYTKNYMVSDICKSSEYINKADQRLSDAIKELDNIYTSVNNVLTYAESAYQNIQEASRSIIEAQNIYKSLESIAEYVKDRDYDLYRTIYNLLADVRASIEEANNLLLTSKNYYNIGKYKEALDYSVKAKSSAENVNNKISYKIKEIGMEVKSYLINNIEKLKTEMSGYKNRLLALAADPFSDKNVVANISSIYNETEKLIMSFESEIKSVREEELSSEKVKDILDKYGGIVNNLDQINKSLSTEETNTTIKKVGAAGSAATAGTIGLLWFVKKRRKK